MLNRTVAPDFQAINPIHLLEPQHRLLDNGCNLFWFNSGDQDLVRIEWIFANLRFDADNPLLNVACNAMLTEGTSTFSATQIAESVDYYGAFLQADYGYDQSQLTLYTLNRHLGNILPIIKEILTDSQFPDKEVETYVRNAKQKLQVSLEKNDILARRAFNKAIYGNTIYGHSSEAADYQQIRQEHLLQHFRQMYQPVNCTIMIAGKVNDDLIAQVTDTFSDWKNNGSAPDTTQSAIVPATPELYFTEKPDALQSAIRIGINMVNRSHPDFAAMQVLNTVLGGYFGSRLMANIREDKGYTYGIGSGISSLKNAGAFFIATEVGADVCRNAVAEIEKEIELLKTELIPDEELVLVRNYMLGSLLGSLENVLSHADKFKNAYFSGLTNEYYSRYTQTVKTVTAGQLQELANQYWNTAAFVKVIVGKY